MKNRKICRSLTVVNSFLFLAILGIHAVGMRENREWEAVSQKTEGRKEDGIKPKIALTFDDGPHPVSYTHLDVYKRQRENKRHHRKMKKLESTLKVLSSFFLSKKYLTKKNCVLY